MKEKEPLSTHSSASRSDGSSAFQGVGLASQKGCFKLSEIHKEEEELALVHPHALWGSKMGYVTSQKSEISDRLRPNLNPTTLQNHFRSESSDFRHQDPNPELVKHPMSLEASQSSRKSTQRET